MSISAVSLSPTLSAGRGAGDDGACWGTGAGGAGIAGEVFAGATTWASAGMAIAAAAAAPSSRLLRIGGLVDLDFDRSRRLLAGVVREEEQEAQENEDHQDE
jgi:hypothetical protein